MSAAPNPTPDPLGGSPAGSPQNLSGLARVTVFTASIWIGLNIIGLCADVFSNSASDRVSTLEGRTRTRAGKKSLREVLGVGFRESTLGLTWSTLQGLLALLSALLFVLGTYYNPDPGATDLTGGDWFVVNLQPPIDITISFLFFSDFMIQFYLADLRLIHLWQPYAIVDFITFAPIIITWLLLTPQDAAGIGFVRFLRITRGLSLLRGSVSGSIFKIRREDDTKRQIRILVFTVASLVFISACLVHTVESAMSAGGVWLDGNDNPVQWHDALYYLFVTVTTVGYGDITPKSAVGRLVAIGILMFAFTAVPLQVNKLVALMQMQTAWGKPALLKRNQPHVIVCGQLSFTTIADFLTEFFHKNRAANENYKVVFLSSELPAREVEVLVTSALYNKRVQYLVGTPLMFDDIARCKVNRARACFVLANKAAADPDEDDQATFLRTWAFKNSRASLPTYVQILRSHNERHVLATLNEDIDCCFSIERMKMYLLAKSCLAPGFCALVANLLRSDDMAAWRLPEASWKAEYCDGLNYEIYQVEINRRWHDLSFAAVVADVFIMYGLLIVGISHHRARPEGEEGEGEPWQAPPSEGPALMCHFDEIVRPGSRVYVLAPDPTTALDIQLDPMPNALHAVRKRLASLQHGRKMPKSRKKLIKAMHTGRQGRHELHTSASAVGVPEDLVPAWLALQQAALKAEADERAAKAREADDTLVTAVVFGDYGTARVNRAPYGEAFPVDAGGHELEPLPIEAEPKQAERPQRTVTLPGETELHRRPGKGARRPDSDLEAGGLREEISPALLSPASPASPASPTGQRPRRAGVPRAAGALGSKSRRRASSALREADLEGVVVVCGVSDGVHHFIRALREDEVGATPRPVVLLDTQPPSEETFFDIADMLQGETLPHDTAGEELRAICTAGGVHFVQGSPLLLRDLEKAGVERSSAVVVLSDEKGRKDADYDERMVDAASLMAVKLVEDFSEEVAPFTVAGLSPPPRRPRPRRPADGRQSSRATGPSSRRRGTRWRSGAPSSAPTPSSRPAAWRRGRRPRGTTSGSGCRRRSSSSACPAKGTTRTSGPARAPRAACGPSPAPTSARPTASGCGGGWRR